MIETLETSITPIPSEQGSPDASVTVVPADEGVDTAELYRRHTRDSPQCRAQRPSVGLVSTGVLNTPDRVAATGVRRDGRFEIALELRRFDGPMAANDPWIAVVRAELGRLDQGSYRLNVQQTVLRFTDIEHPELTSDPVVTERSLDFDCV